MAFQHGRRRRQRGDQRAQPQGSRLGYIGRGECPSETGEHEFKMNLQDPTFFFPDLLIRLRTRKTWIFQGEA